MIEIVAAQTGEALEQVIALAREYVTWMTAEIRRQYPELDIHAFTSERAYDDLRKKYPGEHVPPYGCILVALGGGQVHGCVALGRLDGRTGEMRTLYVRPAIRGTGVGQKLAEACLQEARRLGYSRVRLDTLRFMDGAYKLYRSLGFYDIDPYYAVAPSLRQYIRFLEVDLYNGRAAGA